MNILATTLSGLQVLIEICEQYANGVDMKCNEAKSVYLVVGGRRCKWYNRTVTLNGAKLHRVQAIGHHTSNDDRDSYGKSC